MTKQEILQVLYEINTDAACHIRNEDYDALNVIVDSVYKTGLNKEDCFYDTLLAFRLVDMPFVIAGHNYLCEDLRDRIWHKYEPLINDLVIHNMTLADFLAAYGYTDEYDALNASSNDRKIYNRRIIKRIKLIEDYTEKYHKLVKLYDSATVTQIHKSIRNTDDLQNRFISAVVELIKAREKFNYCINYELVGWDMAKLNKELEALGTIKARLNRLKNITDNIFTTLQNDSTVNFRDFFIIKDNKRETFTSFLRDKKLSDNSWFNYKKPKNKKFVNDRAFYLQMAFFLGLPTSKEVEKFLNFNGHTIKCPFKLSPNDDIYDYDVCRYIDAGIDYHLINLMLRYEFEKTTKTP